MSCMFELKNERHDQTIGEEVKAGEISGIMGEAGKYCSTGCCQSGDYGSPDELERTKAGSKFSS